jgi:hypothetical protein
VGRQRPHDDIEQNEAISTIARVPAVHFVFVIGAVPASILHSQRKVARQAA